MMLIKQMIRKAAEARTKLARAFKDKAKSVKEKYIFPPKSTDFAFIYAPTESLLFNELTSLSRSSNKRIINPRINEKI